MRKISLFMLFCFLCEIHIFACTNFLVGKYASVDGSTMITYSADSYALFGELYHWPAKKYSQREMLKVYEWDSGKYLGEIAQASQTYNVVGNMNEYQVTIGETTFGGRENWLIRMVSSTMEVLYISHCNEPRQQEKLLK